MESSKVVLKINIKDGSGRVLGFAGKPYDVVDSDDNAIYVESELEDVVLVICKDDGGISTAIEKYIVEPMMLN